MSTPFPPALELPPALSGLTSQLNKTSTATNPGALSANAVKIIGFTIGALALIGLSRIVPTGAAFISIAVLLGVGLTHSTEISTLVNRLTGALGAPQASPLSAGAHPLVK